MKGATKLASVLDTVVNEAKAAAAQRATETTIVKEAAAAPRTELGKGLRALANQLRTSNDDLTYGDLS